MNSLITKRTVAFALSALTLSVGVFQGSFSTENLNAKASGSIIYCCPNGIGDGSSKDSPTNVWDAIKDVDAGGTIYMFGGTYTFEYTVLIDDSNNGRYGAYKTIKPYNNEEVVWDFSAMKTDGSNRGVVLDGDYWHFYGFEITKAGDNGMLLSGSNNRIEMMTFNDNQDTGLQISRYNTKADDISSWPSYNLILNCTSKNNCDDATMENADGFAAKLTCGEGNVFDGCMAYNNSDDGWDLFAKSATGPIGTVTIQNSIAFRNGYTEFGEGYGDCDGNGFKLGGSGVGSPHVVKNCLAFENLHCGFTDNNNPKLESLTNCTAFNNNFGEDKKPNFSVYRCTDDGCDFSGIVSYYTEKAVSDKFVGTIENSLIYNDNKYKRISSKIDIANNQKAGEQTTLSDSDFVSLSIPEMGTDFHKLWRNANGTLNTHGFMETSSNGSVSSIGFTSAYTSPYVGNLPDNDDSSSKAEESSSKVDDSSSKTEISNRVEISLIKETDENTLKYRINDGDIKPGDKLVFALKGNNGELQYKWGCNGYGWDNDVVYDELNGSKEISVTVPNNYEDWFEFQIFNRSDEKNFEVTCYKMTGESQSDSSSEVEENSSKTDDSSSKVQESSSEITESSSQVEESSSEIAESSSKTEESSSEVDNVKLGDVNFDGNIGSDDALNVLKNVVGISEFSDREQKAADTDKNGKVEVEDALLILRYVVGLVHEF